MTDRLICFVDKDGQSGICTHHYDDIHVEGDCDSCNFKAKFLGKEKDEFSYTYWAGELDKDIEPDLETPRFEIIKAEFKVPSELQQRIWQLIDEAQWYWTATGIQTEHVSDLSLEEHYIENEEDVISGIVKEVLDFYNVTEVME